MSLTSMTTSRRRAPLWCAVLLCALSAARCWSAPLHPGADVLAGFELVRNGHYTQALEAARRAAVAAPADPLPLLLEAQARFDLIFCQTGHINARELWHAVDHLDDNDKTPHDTPFAQALTQAGVLADRMKRVPATAAEGHFFDGGVHGYRARLATLREQNLPSGREGKRMREELLAAAAADPSLAPETDFGLGLYNYYADSLSPIVKLFRFFLLIPGGDLERGLAQLHHAAEARSLAQTSAQQPAGNGSSNGNNHSPAGGENGHAPAILMQPEARWELARIVGVREGRHEEAVQLLTPLVELYPDNALFALLATQEAEGSGNLELARTFSEKAERAAGRIDPACRPRLEPATRDAATRIAEALRAQQTAPQ